MTGRDLEDQELALEFLEYIGWTIMGDAQNYRQTKERQEVLDVLMNADGPLMPNQIAEKLNKKRVTISYLLNQMLKAGSISQDSYGKYISNTPNTTNSLIN